jgi:hypothetical protein
LLDHNPFAINPLLKALLPMLGYSYLDETDEFERIVGTILEDILPAPTVAI